MYKHLYLRNDPVEALLPGLGCLQRKLGLAVLANFLYTELPKIGILKLVGDETKRSH